MEWTPQQSREYLWATRFSIDLGAVRIQGRMCCPHKENMMIWCSLMSGQSKTNKYWVVSDTEKRRRSRRTLFSNSNEGAFPERGWASLSQSCRNPEFRSHHRRKVRKRIPVSDTLIISIKILTKVESTMKYVPCWHIQRKNNIHFPYFLLNFYVIKLWLCIILQLIKHPVP